MIDQQGKKQLNATEKQKKQLKQIKDKKKLIKKTEEEKKSGEIMLLKENLNHILL